MKLSEVSRRYAKALYDTTKVNHTSEKVLSELRALQLVFEKEHSVKEFVASPVISPEQKMNLVKTTFESKVSNELYNTLILLAEKNRLGFFAEIAHAFEQFSDEDHGVSRGSVKSATHLGLEERKRVEETVNKVIGKKVILNFAEDPRLLGGMVAQVGGWTFDDSLSAHLKRMNEELNRRAN
jgi:F-type H+-transporting ATPase subunit delta